MEFYYTDRTNIDEKSGIILVKDESFKHLVKVLRKKTNDVITVTDGNYNVYDCLITDVGKNTLRCKITYKHTEHNEPSETVTLFLSQLRNLDRFEFAMEKSVELGINSIYPVISDYVVNKTPFPETKIKRFKKIIISAAEQSQRCFIPRIHNSICFNEMLYLSNNFESRIAMYEFAKPEERISDIKKYNNTALFIGPEGGLSDNEVLKLKENKWCLKSLGKRKIRAETAAIISLSKLIYL